MPEYPTCPLCRADRVEHFFSDARRDYQRCNCCGLIHVPKKFFLTATDEKAIYDLHRNSPEDAGYRKFLSRVLEPLLPRLEANSIGLDFGSGPGPALPVMLAEAGHRVRCYDPFYAAEGNAFSETYDLRRGSFQKGWEQFLYNIRQKRITRQTKGVSCSIIDMCGMCPANAELECKHAEAPGDFLCQVAHLRAYALGLPVESHGQCEYCEGGARYSEMMHIAGKIKVETQKYSNA